VREGAVERGDTVPVEVVEPDEALGPRVLDQGRPGEARVRRPQERRARRGQAGP
jgi:hypothetical protein